MMCTKKYKICLLVEVESTTMITVTKPLPIEITLNIDVATVLMVYEMLLLQ